MCQLAYASNLTKINKQVKIKIFNAIQEDMTSSNRHGYGVAIRTKTGVQTKKTTNVRDMITNNFRVPLFCKAPESGELDVDSAIEAIFHARTSTNTVNLDNTHPFTIGNTTLCHNGVVRYAGEKYDKKTDNDTEDLTFHFDKYGMTNFSQLLTGYAAFVAFKDDKTYVVRDNKAYLTYMYSQKLDCHFFATKASTLEKICDILKLKLKILDLKDNQYIEIKDNKIIVSEEWGGLAYSSYAASHAKTSLGRSIDDNQQFEGWRERNGYYAGKYADRYDREQQAKLPYNSNSSEATVLEMTKTPQSFNDHESYTLWGWYMDNAHYWGVEDELKQAMDDKEILVKHESRVLTWDELQRLESKLDVEIWVNNI